MIFHQSVLAPSRHGIILTRMSSCSISTTAIACKRSSSPVFRKTILPLKPTISCIGVKSPSPQVSSTSFLAYCQGHRFSSPSFQYRSFFSFTRTGEKSRPDIGPPNSSGFKDPNPPTEYHSSLHETHPLPIRQEFISQRLTTKDLENLDIGLSHHRVPEGLGDHIALGIVKALRVPADMFFRKKYVHRAVVLETVAAVPGMVGAVVRHLQSLRLMRHDGGWIAHLLHEAENERMHLLTWMRVSSPTFFERMLVTVVQGGFFTIFFTCYLFAPRICHRVVGYLEEEAIISYNGFLHEIDVGHIDNGPAPDIAISYWNLPEDARLRDVVLAVRADEANHRDVNHELADRILHHRENLRASITNGRTEENAQSVWQKPGRSD